MNTWGKWAVIVALISVAGAAGYWWGTTQQIMPEPARNQVPDRKILYYRNPMGLPDTSPVPKKDPMGMDYIPVYEGEQPALNGPDIKISKEKIQKLGVKTSAVTLRELTRTVRAVSTVQPNERLLYNVAPKFEGWIQQLYVNTTGQVVKKGDRLMDVYSPELITAQHEYLVARKGMQLMERGDTEVVAGMRRLGESALQRLRNWDIAEADLNALQQEGHVSQYLTLRSPANGVVLQKPPVRGQRFAPGEMLYQIADLSRVWMLADVFEQDLAMVHPGQSATIRIDAYPEKVFSGNVTYIYPTVNPETRTAKVRIELANPEQLLKPDMYGRVEISSAHSKNKVLAVDESAVLHTGTRQLVLVDLGEGRFEPRTVKLGLHADGYAEVLGGLTAGEIVVVKANFLIDAESNLKAALSGFGHGAHGPASEELENRKRIGPRPSDIKPSTPSPQTTHRGEGVVEAIDLTHTVLTLNHGPIPSLEWSAMTMDFRVLDPAWLRTLKPGQRVVFEITEESAGEYVIVHVQTADASSEHGGH